MQAVVHINFSSIVKVHFFYEDGKRDLGVKCAITLFSLFIRVIESEIVAFYD